MRRYNTQHNAIHHKDTQHIIYKLDIQYNDTQYIDNQYNDTQHVDTLYRQLDCNPWYRNGEGSGLPLCYWHSPTNKALIFKNLC